MSSRMLHDCDLCGSDDFTPIEVARPYIGDNEPPVVCMKCGFIYVRNRRTSEEVAKSWDDIWGEGYTSEWPAVKARLFYVAEWLDQTIGLKGKELLDIGAGEGTFLKMVEERGAQGTGLEPSSENADAIRMSGIACWNETIEEVEGTDYFDIITILWTLENCADCIGMLKRARELLKPDVHIVVATGSRIGVPFKKPLSKYFSDNPADTHCFRFSSRSLFRALKKVRLLAAENNSFVDSDCMVVAACEATFGTIDAIDHPREVLDFFQSWSEQFP